MARTLAKNRRRRRTRRSVGGKRRTIRRTRMGGKRRVKKTRRGGRRRNRKSRRKYKGGLARFFKSEKEVGKQEGKQEEEEGKSTHGSTKSSTGVPEDEVLNIMQAAPKAHAVREQENAARLAEARQDRTASEEHGVEAEKVARENIMNMIFPNGFSPPIKINGSEFLGKEKECATCSRIFPRFGKVTASRRHCRACEQPKCSDCMHGDTNIQDGEVPVAVCKKCIGIINFLKDNPEPWLWSVYKKALVPP